jgi:hypothetical protein
MSFATASNTVYLFLPYTPCAVVFHWVCGSSTRAFRHGSFPRSKQPPRYSLVVWVASTLASEMPLLSPLLSLRILVTVIKPCMIEYIAQWNLFIKLRLLNGCAYSDCYYIDRILAGMQPALRIHFEPAISHLCMSSPIDHALPSQLHPLSLVGTLTQRAKELGHPEYMALTTRALQDAPIHELEMHAVLGVRQCYICPTRKRLEEPAIRRQLGLPPLPAQIHQIDVCPLVSAPDSDTPSLDPVDPYFQ